ncbi:MAG: hydroxysqualene dehydroxylase HpnE [Planctomycetota bacterium]|nr:hydroxysqualene dehydroxylase HpnE [Planctomycetota bacterium]
MKRTVVIIGGGLAGIAAALRLIETEYKPILIESSRRLGGRATSFDDPRTGETLDNCQHVVMGCCTNLLDLYERLGVLESIAWGHSVYWTSGRGEIDELGAGWLPAPLHLAGAMRRMKLLSNVEKRHIAKAMWRIIRMGSKGRFEWRDSTFRAFLDHCKQPESVITRFWNVIVVSACNLDVDRCGAAFAIQVFQDGFMSNRFGYSVGLPTTPLRELYDPAISMIEQGGGEVRLGCSAKALAYDSRRITGVNTLDGMIDASAVMCAVPFDRLDKLVSSTLRKADTRLQKLDAFAYSPILGVHLFFDQTIMELPHLTVVDHDIQWVFNKGVDEQGRQHLHVVISAADVWMDLDEAEITRRLVKDIHSVLPKAKGLDPIRVRVIKEKRATFAPTPGIDSIRPGPASGTVGLAGGGVPNLYLAGDWTDVGWPSTMEGAVRSGYAASEAITGQGGLVDDIPTSLLGLALGLR